MDSGLAPYSYCVGSFALSPCGRGLNGVATIAMGEGASSQKELLAKRTPHPFSDVAPPSRPLPQGERANSAPASRAAPAAPCLLAGARVLARRTKLELAGGELLLVGRQLGRDGRRHRGVERAAGQLLERGAGRLRRIVAVHLELADKLAALHDVGDDRIHLRPFLDHVGEDLI